jgi:hypothetical protein
VFRKLDAARVVDTASRLRRRVEERFPASGLSQVASEVEGVTREAAALSAWLARPNVGLRAAVGSGIVLLVAVVIAAAVQVRADVGPRSWADWVQAVESLINDAVFVGIAIYFLLGIETRRKRKRALEALHVLRSLAHIVDMHQLTKDPERLDAGQDTASSPARTMSAFELTRYLDYSTELLAIVSKVAALYVQELSDPVTVAAASAVEELAVSLSRAIWQKIVILDRVLSPEAVQEAVHPS